MRRVVSLIAAVAVIALSPAAALAAVQCQPQVNSAGGLSQAVAVDTWRTQVTNQLGASWADFDLATGVQYSQTNLALVTMYFVSAKACRLVVKPVVVNRVPGTPGLSRP